MNRQWREWIMAASVLVIVTGIFVIPYNLFAQPYALRPTVQEVGSVEGEAVEALRAMTVYAAKLEAVLRASDVTWITVENANGKVTLSLIDIFNENGEKVGARSSVDFSFEKRTKAR